MKTLADLKRLPIGTRLVLVNCLMGPCRKTRTLKRVASRGLVFETETGSESHLDFSPGEKVEPTEKGFRLVLDGRLMAEYEMEAA